jgi:hypothetical protein
MKAMFQCKLYFSSSNVCIIYVWEETLTDLVNWTKTTFTNLVSRIEVPSCRFDLTQSEGANLQVKSSEFYRKGLYVVINIY